MSDLITTSHDHERLRQPEYGEHRPSKKTVRRQTSHTIADIQPTEPKSPAVPRPRLTLPQVDHSPPVVPPQPFTEPAVPRQRPSQVLARTSVKLPRQHPNLLQRERRWQEALLQTGLIGLAVLVFVVGMASSLQTLKAEHDTSEQVAALANKTSTTAVSSIANTSGAAVSQYAVALDEPRNLKIPKLNVDARVVPAVVSTTGALGTPDNAADTAWYTGSAKPGQPGATLMSGDVTDWTNPGVFYKLATLVPGDSIQIERGDGAIIKYQVVKVQVFSGSGINNQTALTPILSGDSGLNLMTSAANSITGTDLFNQQIVVFARQVH